MTICQAVSTEYQKVTDKQNCYINIASVRYMLPRDKNGNQLKPEFFFIA